MNTKQAHPVIDQLQAVGLKMTLNGERVRVTNSDLLNDELRALIRAHKPEIVEWLAATQTPPAANDATRHGTQRPDGMTPALMAASHALDQRVLAAGGTLTIPPDSGHQFKVDPWRANPKPPPPPSKPARAQHTHHVAADWRPLGQAYNLHHAHCPACQCAGRGHGQRCGVGAALWTPYQAAFE